MQSTTVNRIYSIRVIAHYVFDYVIQNLSWTSGQRENKISGLLFGCGLEFTFTTVHDLTDFRPFTLVLYTAFTHLRTKWDQRLEKKLGLRL